MKLDFALRGSIMNKVFAFMIMFTMIFALGCSEENRIDDESKLMAYLETDQDKIDEYESLFDKSSTEGTFASEFSYYLADINGDNEYEILRTYWYGSGMITSCIECYESTTNTVSRIDERFKANYTFFLYKDELYVMTAQDPLSSHYEIPHAYRPILQDSQLYYEKVEDELEQEVLENFDNNYFFMPFE